MTRKFIPVTPENSPSGEICRTCTAACCVAGTTMEITRTEVRRIKNAGGKLTMMVQPEPFARSVSLPGAVLRDEATGVVYQVLNESYLIQADRGMWRLDSDCPFLVTTEGGVRECGDYANRMQICREFQEGGKVCCDMRKNSGIDDSGIVDRLAAIQAREQVEVAVLADRLEAEIAERNEDTVYDAILRMMQGPSGSDRKPVAPTKRTNVGGKKRKR